MIKMNWTLSAALLAVSCAVSTAQAKAEPLLGNSPSPSKRSSAGRRWNPANTRSSR